jgi:hypothetical protein
MPLTFSHPAIVLPLKYLPKRWISLTGLVIGSVTPDFEYFARMKVSSIYSHTWFGLLWFDLPVGLLLCFVYHDIVKGTSISHLPKALRSRFEQYNALDWNNHFIKNSLVIILSILVGSTSHLFWDSFTHVTGYFVVLWDMVKPISLFGIEMPLYKLVQHCSTLIGGIVILAAIYKMPNRPISKPAIIWPYWFTAIGVALSITALRIVFGLSIHQYWNILVTAISAMILGIILTSLLFKRNPAVLVP